MLWYFCSIAFILVCTGTPIQRVRSDPASIIFEFINDKDHNYYRAVSKWFNNAIKHTRRVELSKVQTLYQIIDKLSCNDELIIEYLSAKSKYYNLSHQQRISLYQNEDISQDSKHTFCQMIHNASQSTITFNRVLDEELMPVIIQLKAIRSKIFDDELSFITKFICTRDISNDRKRQLLSAIVNEEYARVQLLMYFIHTEISGDLEFEYYQEHIEGMITPLINQQSVKFNHQIPDILCFIQKTDLSDENKIKFLQIIRAIPEFQSWRPESDSLQFIVVPFCSKTHPFPISVSKRLSFLAHALLHYFYPYTSSISTIYQYCKGHPIIERLSAFGPWILYASTMYARTFDTFTRKTRYKDGTVINKLQLMEDHGFMALSAITLNNMRKEYWSRWSNDTDLQRRHVMDILNDQHYWKYWYGLSDGRDVYILQHDLPSLLIEETLYQSHNEYQQFVQFAPIQIAHRILELALDSSQYRRKLCDVYERLYGQNALLILALWPRRDGEDAKKFHAEYLERLYAKKNDWDKDAFKNKREEFEDSVAEWLMIKGLICYDNYWVLDQDELFP